MWSAAGTWNGPIVTTPTTMSSARLTLFSKVGEGSLQSFSQPWNLSVYRVSATEVRFHLNGGSPSTFVLITPTVPVPVSAGLSLSGRAEYTPA